MPCHEPETLRFVLFIDVLVDPGSFLPLRVVINQEGVKKERLLHGTSEGDLFLGFQEHLGEDTPIRQQNQNPRWMTRELFT
jgi:hypothetical protein